MKKFFLTILGWIYISLAHFWTRQDQVCTECGWTGRRAMDERECPKCGGAVVERHDNQIK